MLQDLVRIYSVSGVACIPRQQVGADNEARSPSDSLEHWMQYDTIKLLVMQIESHVYSPKSLLYMQFKKAIPLQLASISRAIRSIENPVRVSRSALTVWIMYMMRVKNNKLHVFTFSHRTWQTKRIEEIFLYIFLTKDNHDSLSSRSTSAPATCEEIAKLSNVSNEMSACH